MTGPPKRKKPARRASAGGLSGGVAGSLQNQQSNSNTTAKSTAAQRRRRGRPVGRKSLVHSFDVALWLVGSNFGLGAYDAAGLAILLLSEHPIDSNSVEGGAVKLSTDLRTTTLKGRAGSLVKKCDIPLHPNEIHWMRESVIHLTMLFSCHLGAALTPPQREAWGRFSSQNLEALGWSEPMERIFLRLKTAVASNAPPDEEPLTRKVRAFLENFDGRSRPINLKTDKRSRSGHNR